MRYYNIKSALSACIFAKFASKANKSGIDPGWFKLIQFLDAVKNEIKNAQSDSVLNSKLFALTLWPENGFFFKLIAGFRLPLFKLMHSVL